MRSALAALVALACGPAPLLADDELEVCLEAPCRVASHEELDGLRGGFDLDSDRGRLRVSIGITRSVSINDRLVATSTLVLTDIGRLISQARGGRQTAPQLTFNLPSGSNPLAPSQLTVNNTPVSLNGPPIEVHDAALIVQNGPGNSVNLQMPLTGSMPIIIQNTLDNQKISTSTSLSSTVNSLSILHGLRTAEMMRRATISSGR